MKKVGALIIIAVLLLLSSAFTQDQATVSVQEHQRVRDLLVGYVDRCERLEAENIQLRTVAGSMRDLIDKVRKVKDMGELDKLLSDYGIEREKDG